MDDAAVLQEHFLKDAVYKETTEGVQIGVFRSTMGYGVHLTVVNFHGHVIGNQQPVVIEPLRGYGRAAPEYWFTRIHVDHAPQLELVLPARNEVVSNNYWTELLVQCERAIYNAMARTEPQPKLRHWDWRRAQSLGVTLREPPARLNPWQPRKQEDRLRSHQQRSSPTTAVTETENTRPIVMRAHVSPPEEHALARALRLSDTPVQLMADDPNLSGYQWYNDLEYVIEVQVYEETAGTRSVLPAHDEDEDQPEHGYGRQDRMRVARTNRDRPDREHRGHRRRRLPQQHRRGLARDRYRGRARERHHDHEPGAHDDDGRGLLRSKLRRGHREPGNTARDVQAGMPDHRDDTAGIRRRSAEGIPDNTGIGVRSRTADDRKRADQPGVRAVRRAEAGPRAAPTWSPPRRSASGGAWPTWRPRAGFE